MDDSAAVPLLSHAPDTTINHTGSHTMESALSEKPMTAVEQKCLLIDREIDACGMGNYQWYIWFLCGFGYLIDLLWAQAFGLVLGPLGQELGFQGNESGNISIAFSSGLTIGAFTWGVLVDIIGRKWAFNLTCFFSAIFGLALGGCNTYTAFLVVTACVGFGVGGNIPIDTTICLEFIPKNKRFLLALLSIFQPIGVVLTCAVAYGFIPNYSCSPDFSQPDKLLACNQLPQGEPCCRPRDNRGWRYLMFTLGSITLLAFFLRFVVFNFQESPKFLVYQGKDEEAARVLQHIANVNGKKCEQFECVEAASAKRPLTFKWTSYRQSADVLHTHLGTVSVADFKAVEDETASDKAPFEWRRKESWSAKLSIEGARYGQLFQTWQMSRLTILVWLTYICDASGFTLAGTFLPAILAIKNGDLNLSLEFTYRSYFAIYAPGIVAVALAATMTKFPQIGRRVTMIISSALMGVSIILFSLANGQASNIGLNAMEYFFQSMFNAVLYGWTPEVFPTSVRGTASGLASFWGRLFSIITPIIANSILGEDGLMDPVAVRKILYFAGGITLGCVVTIALMPHQALGKKRIN